MSYFVHRMYSIRPYEKYIRTVRSDSDCKNTSYHAQHGVLGARMKYFVHEMAKEINLYYLTWKIYNFNLFF